MAAVIARKQYLAVMIVKDWFVRTKIPNFACGVLFSNKTHNEKLPKKRRPRQSQSSILFQKTGTKLDFGELKSSYGYDQKYQYYMPIKELEIVISIGKALGTNINQIFYELKKHPKRRFINIEEVQKTITFLKDFGFSNEDIAGSVAICFYPKDNIMKGFEKITKCNDELAKIGIFDGFTLDKTSDFRNGLTSNDKRLQLCLYYMESPFAFNGSGIFPSA